MIKYWSVTAINKEMSTVCEVSREISDLSLSLNTMTLLQFYNSATALWDLSQEIYFWEEWMKNDDYDSKF